MTISVSLRPVGASGLLVEVYAKTKVLRASLEKTLEEVLGCDRKEGPPLQEDPYQLMTQVAEQLHQLRPQDNWYITYWASDGEPWELRYNRPGK